MGDPEVAGDQTRPANPGRWTEAAFGQERDADDGGILIIFAVMLSTLLWADMTNRYVWLVVMATVGFGAVGFADDYLKFIKRQSKGLSAAQNSPASFWWP
ncbi:MAG: hypothetical protein MRJ92_15160 [Nitrospira sp.]|nr:hypothetical protein [Nitrospira sp.]